MNKYKSVKWLELRERVLKRDKYKCRECTRFGFNIQATTVHHVLPAEDYPKLFYDKKNLYSVCGKCHNSFHNRTTDELTTKGIDLAKRIYKTTPLPKPCNN